MIRGRFDSERPIIAAEVRITGQAPSGFVVLGAATIDLLLDTGADRTTISVAHWTERLGLRLDQARPGRPVLGLGGLVSAREAEGVILFEHEDRTLTALSLRIAVWEPNPTGHNLPLSLLGRDIWGLGRVSLHLRTGEVLLELPPNLPPPGR